MLLEIVLIFMILYELPDYQAFAIGFWPLADFISLTPDPDFWPYLIVFITLTVIVIILIFLWVINCSRLFLAFLNIRPYQAIILNFLFNL